MLLYMDGFDHYGVGAGSRTAMLQGPYTNVPTEISSFTARAAATNPRTGARAIRFSAVNSVQYSGNRAFRHAISTGAQATVGAAISWNISTMPPDGALILLGFYNASGVAQVTLTQTATGQISAVRGYAKNGSGAYPNGTVLGVTPGPVLFTGAYQHIEARVYSHATAGTVEVRVDGVTVLSLSAVNTQNTASPAGIAQVCFGLSDVSSPGKLIAPDCDADDFYVWDTSGAYNNDFIGVRGVYALYPDANEMPQEWDVSSGSAYAALAKNTPDDSSYVYADDNGMNPMDIQSVFSLTDLPDGVGAISAVQPVGRFMKTDSGPANVQMSILSEASAAEGADRPITTAFAYWYDVLETDPATGAPWTREAVQASSLRLTRTS